MESILLEKNRKSALPLTLLIFVIELTYGISSTAYIVLMPNMIEFYHTTFTDMGSLNACWGLGSILSVLLLMVILDKLSKPRVLLVILLAFLFSMFIQGIAPPFSYMPVANVIWGASNLAMDTVNASILADIYKEKSNTYINILQGIFAFGCILGPFITQFVLSLGYQWNIVYMLFTFIIIATIPFFVLILYKNKDFIKNLKSSNQDMLNGKEISIKQFLLHKEVQLAMIVIVFLIGAQSITQTWIVQYMSEDLHSQEIISASVSALFFTGLAISRFTSPIFRKHGSPIKTLSVVLFFGGILTFGAYLCVNEYILAAGSLCLGLSIGNANPLMISHLCSIFPNQSGRATSFIFIGIGTGVVVFAYIGATAVTLLGLKYGIALAALLISFASIPVFRLFKINAARKDVPLVAKTSGIDIKA